MGKTKDSKSAKASKVLASVKESRVTKPEVASKKSSKQDTAKKAKASKRAPTPDSESSSSASDSEADSGSASDEDVSDNSSDSSDSSDSEAEQKPTKAQPSKVNGAAKVANGVKPTVNDNDDDDDSDSSEGSDSDDEAPARPSKAAPNAKSVATGAKDDDDSSDSSDSSDDSDDEGKPTLNGKAAKKADESSEGSSESDSDEEVAAQPEPVKKRKADFAEAPAAKKAKAFEGENGNAVANLFVGNLSWNVDEEWLRREFEEFGEVVGCRIITDRDSGRSKGFGYVEFAQVEDATTALEAKKGGLLDGRELNIDYSTPRPKTQQSNDRGQWANDRANKYGDVKSEPTATLWVGNISFNASSDDINNAFAEYGTITRVALPTDMETGAPKGYGYVDFTTVEEAQAAFEGLNGYEIAGRSIRIDYASPRTGGGDRGGRGRGGFGGFNDRGRGGRGGFNDRGRGGRGGRGGFNDRGRGGGRGNFSKNRGGLGDFSGTKMTF